MKEKGFTPHHFPEIKSNSDFNNHNFKILKNSEGFISIKAQLIILAVLLFIMSLEITGLALNSKGKLFPLFRKISLVFAEYKDAGESLDEGEAGLTFKPGPESSDEEMEKRIKELEQKIKDLEENQQVPFPPEEYFLPPLTQEQISAVVELWCPDDDYNYSGYISIGSGSIVSPEGIIITNRHVISNEDWSVIRSTPTCYVAITEDIAQSPIVKYAASLVAYAPATDDYFDFDVAILYINDVCRECEGAPSSLPSSFSYLDLGYSDVLAPGDYVAIAGYPGIGAGTFNFTDGIISGRVGEFILKTDAKIDSGNSGGSALNSKNQLIGAPTWTISGQAESMGYIIAIDQIVEWYETKVVPSDSVIVPY